MLRFAHRNTLTASVSIAWTSRNQRLVTWTETTGITTTSVKMTGSEVVVFPTSSQLGTSHSWAAGRTEITSADASDLEDIGMIQIEEEPSDDWPLRCDHWRSAVGSLRAPEMMLIDTTVPVRD